LRLMPSRCLLFAGSNSNECFMCRKNYAKNSQIGSCSYSFIDKCAWEEFKFGKRLCKWCWNGIPSEDGQSCLSFGPQTTIDNCAMGGRRSDGTGICIRCNEDYYTGEDGGQCVSNVGSGCAIFDFRTKKCLMCDTLNGFESLHVGRCTPMRKSTINSIFKYLKAALAPLI